jgi:hypothetical protein
MTVEEFRAAVESIGVEAMREIMRLVMKHRHTRAEIVRRVVPLVRRHRRQRTEKGGAR